MPSIMRIALAGLLAGTVFAQSNAGLPSCAAKSCVTSDYGGCEALDIKCICTRGSWIAGLACCVSEACDAAGQEATIQFANAICGSVGEASALPTAATCAPGQTPTLASGGAVASSSGSATVSSASSSVTSAPSSSSTSTSTSGSSNTATSGTSTMSTSASASASASTTAGASGASAYQAQGAGFVLGLAGLLAAL